MKEVLVKFGEMMDENMNVERLEAREIYEKVTNALKVLPGISVAKRFKATQVIGKDVLLGRSFLRRPNKKRLTWSNCLPMVEIFWYSKPGNVNSVKPPQKDKGISQLLHFSLKLQAHLEKMWKFLRNSIFLKKNQSNRRFQRNQNSSKPKEHSHNF
ncbi:hypothetical protein OSB04_016915 [Centaurea solstitialis]|uniref:Uncharacterized protein n=1 Tax=Centaurea solstitialis TaxID=347529 RepID=A0AA38T1W7_9ASTR|nr:hypothetical protein OSB04_016915 [Centaurea solstitialis]